MGGIPIGISNWRNFGNSERELVIRYPLDFNSSGL